jgi:hypothetical protein
LCASITIITTLAVIGVLLTESFNFFRQVSIVEFFTSREWTPLFTQKNFGTEQIQELLSELLPDARIARMDHDSVKGKNEHDALIKLFEQRAIDILVGTQMVVKGLIRTRP